MTSAPLDDATPHVVRLGGWRELPERAQNTRESELQRLVTAARAAHEAPPPHRPWLEPLPSRLPITTLDTDDAVVIGRVDLPAEQRQPPLTIDVADGTAVLISGRPRSGRSTALHTIAHAAASRHPPSELHIYGIDASGAGLAKLRALPHTGTIATVADGFDLAARLVDRLQTLDAPLAPTHRRLGRTACRVRRSRRRPHRRTRDRVAAVGRSQAAECRHRGWSRRYSHRD